MLSCSYLVFSSGQDWGPDDSQSRPELSDHRFPTPTMDWTKLLQGYVKCRGSRHVWLSNTSSSAATATEEDEQWSRKTNTSHTHGQKVLSPICIMYQHLHKTNKNDHKHVDSHFMCSFYDEKENQMICHCTKTHKKKKQQFSSARAAIYFPLRNKFGFWCLLSTPQTSRRLGFKLTDWPSMTSTILKPPGHSLCFLN